MRKGEGVAADIRKTQVLAVVGLALFWQLFRFSNLRALFGTVAGFGVAANEVFLLTMVAAAVVAGAASLSGTASRFLATPLVCLGLSAVQAVCSIALVVAGNVLAPGFAIGAQVVVISLALVSLLFAWTSLLRGLRGSFRGCAILIACSMALAFFMSLCALYVVGDEALLSLLMVPGSGLLLYGAYRMLPGQDGDGEGSCAASYDGAASGVVAGVLDASDRCGAWLALPGAFQNSRSFLLLTMSTALFFLLSLSVSGSISPAALGASEGPSTAAKHLATIAEILLFVMVLYVSRDARKALYAGWLLFSGLFLAGVAMLGLAGSGVVGAGVVLSTAARGCFELLLFVLAMMLTGRFSPCRCIVLSFLVPEVVASVASRGLLPWAFSQMGLTFSGYIPLVSLVLSALMIVGVGLLLVVELFSRIGREPSDRRGQDAEIRPESASERQDAAGDLFGLSPAERRIAGYLMRGYTAEGIAEQEHLSVNTVRTHIKNIYRKSGVHSRQEFIDVVDGKVR